MVYRRGDVVIRDAAPWTPAVHALLRHLEDAGFAAAPRLVGSGLDTDGREVLLEGRLAADVQAELRKRGHDVTTGPDWTMKVGGMQAVAVDPETRVMTGAADPRRDGYAVAL